MKGWDAEKRWKKNDSLPSGDDSEYAGETGLSTGDAMGVIGDCIVGGVLKSWWDLDWVYLKQKLRESWL